MFFMYIINDLIEGYDEVLEAFPITTKALTSATVYTIGDIIAQRSEGAKRLDKWRIVRSLLAGLIGHGPLSHIWYNLNEDLFQHWLGWTAWWVVFPKGKSRIWALSVGCWCIVVRDPPFSFISDSVYSL